MNHTTPRQFASIQNVLREIQPDLLKSIDAIWQSPQTPHQQLILIARLARHDTRIAEIVTALIPLRLTTAPERLSVEAELARATGRPVSSPGRPIPRPEPRPGEGPDPVARHTPRPEPIEIRIDPEIARLAVAMRRDSELRLWMVLKFVSGASGAFLPAEGLFQRVRCLVRDYTPRHFRRLLAAGTGTFWRIDDQRRVWLAGSPRLAAALVRLAGPQLVSSNRPGARDMWIPVGDTIQHFRAHVLGAWYAHREHPQISRAKQAELWGCTPQTLRRWEALGARVRVQRNYGQVLIGGKAPLHSWPCVLDNPSVGKCYSWHGEIMITRQLPNTYFVTGYRQAARRGRARKRRDAVAAVESALPVVTGAGHCQRLYWADGKRLEAHNRRADAPQVAWVYLGQDRRGLRRWELTTGRPDTQANSRARGATAYRYWSDQAARRRAFLEKSAQDIFVALYTGETLDYAKAAFEGPACPGGEGARGSGGNEYAAN